MILQRVMPRRPALALGAITALLLSPAVRPVEAQMMERREQPARSHGGGGMNVGTGMAIGVGIGIAGEMMRQRPPQKEEVSTPRKPRAARKDGGPKNKDKDKDKGPAAAKAPADPVAQDTGEFKPRVPVGTREGKPVYQEVPIRITRTASGTTEITYRINRTTYPLDTLGTPTTVARGGDPTKNVTVTARGRTVGPPREGELQPPTLRDGNAFGGRMILFCVDGCETVKFVQFVRSETTYSNPSAVGPGEATWGYDTGNKRPGEYGQVPVKDRKAPAQPAMYDAPGQWGQPDPKDRNGTSVAKVGDTVTINNTFETFVCCDKVWIGYWTWSERLTFTYRRNTVGAGGTFGSPEVDAPVPTWHEGTAGATNAATLLAEKMFACP